MDRSIISFVIWSGVVVGSLAAEEDSQELASYRLERARIAEIKDLDIQTASGKQRLFDVLRSRESASYEVVAALRKVAAANIDSAVAQQAVLRLISPKANKHDCDSAIGLLHRLKVPADVAIPVLLPALEDNRNCSPRGCSSGVISTHVVSVIGSYGPDAASAIPTLVWGIDPANNWPLDERTTKFALGNIDPQQFPFYAQGDAAIKPLIAELESEIIGRRRVAASRLLQLHDFATPAIPHLEELLDDQDKQLRVWSATAILAMVNHEKAVEVFQEYSRSANYVDRWRSMSWLHSYDLKFDDTKLLVERLSDVQSDVRCLAARRLVETGRNKTAALEALIDLYQQDSHDSKVDAIKAFSAFDAETLSPARDSIEHAAQQQGSLGYIGTRLLRKKFPDRQTDDIIERVESN